MLVIDRETIAGLGDAAEAVTEATGIKKTVETIAESRLRAVSYEDSK